MNKKPFTAVFTALALILIFLAVQVMGLTVFGLYFGVKAGIAGQIPNQEKVMEWILSKMGWMTLMNYSVVFLITWGLLLIRRIKFTEYVSFKKVPPLSLPVLLCYAVGLQGIGSLTINLLNTVIPMMDSFAQMTNSLTSSPITLTVLAMGIVAPFVEEVFFRGVIYKKLANHLPKNVALVFQALLFSLVHMNLAQIPPTFILALALGYLYRKTKNLWNAVIIHMFFNLLALGSLYIPQSYQAAFLAVLYLGISLSVLHIGKRVYDIRQLNGHLKESFNEIDS